ncbi:MAG: esterase [Lachnospiraceae bacterium]|nr:esterase [Lachnospiraceae bacterium]
MTRFEYGNPESSNVLIQMVDDHDLSVIENEVETIIEKAGNDFCLVALKVDDWNHDLSPWTAPAVFGNEAFGEGAEETLSKVLAEVTDSGKRYYIGGYSLAGLFALWAAFQTDKFEGVAAASPSIWFPGFVDYMRNNQIYTRKVYLSLGDREEKTRNPVMASVGDRIRAAYEIVRKRGIACTLEWNKGNHFKDADIRTAAAFVWVMKEQ